jgi:hypothetical protein
MMIRRVWHAWIALKTPTRKIPGFQQIDFVRRDLPLRRKRIGPFESEETRKPTWLLSAKDRSCLIHVSSSECIGSAARRIGRTSPVRATREWTGGDSEFVEPMRSL